MLSYSVSVDCDVPYYKQLVDAIHADIHCGRLAPGEKLPTVRELADELHLACGTIKRAYDELGKLGDLEMSRGRGTFVRYQQENSESRKERAMAYIDRMFDQLDELGLSAQETEIFLKVKLQARAQRAENLRVALVACNEEVLQQVSEQLRALPEADLHPMLLDDVIAYPYAVSDDMDVIVTTVSHYDALLAAIPAKDKLQKVALTLAQETVLALARVGAGHRIGAFYHSERFGKLMQKTLAAYAPGAEIAGVLPLAELQKGGCLDGLDAALVPHDVEKYCGAEEAKRLSAFAKAHSLIPCRTEIDQGSYLFLEERLQALLRARGKLPSEDGGLEE